MTNSLLLNREQRQAIRFENGPLLIIAGAGTGKTTVITERIKYLIKSKLSKTNEILALTFTNKAAEEMLNRLDMVMPLGYEEPWISTFHSFCDRVLREESLDIGLSPDYKILTEIEQLILLRKHLFELNLDYYLPLGNPVKFIESLLKFFSRAKDENVNLSEIKNYALKRFSKKTAEDKENKKKLVELISAFEKYEKIKIKENNLDFGDLICQTIKLFKKRKSILSKYQRQFKYVLIDEFQDTNYSQLQLVKLLTPPKRNSNLTVVGDDDQAIYKWRGASVSNILDFKKHYPEAKEIVLTNNYRSGQMILNSTYKLIKNNNPDRLEVKLRINKKLKAIRKVNITPEIYEFSNLEQETDFIVGKILELAVKGNYTYKDFAILARANSYLDPFILALKRAGIAYQVVGNRGLFNQDEVRDMIFLAKSIVNPYESLNIFQLLHNQSFKISGKEILELLSKSKANKKKLWDILKEESQKENKLAFIVSEIENSQKKIKQWPASKILLSFIGKTNYVKDLLKHESLENELKLKNLSLFFEKITLFERENTKAKLVELVDWLDFMIEAGENPAQAEIEDIDVVSLLTVHASKGLEFPVVFVVNCVTGRFPTRKRNETIEFPVDLGKETLPMGDIHLKEERRLFYVACTRARDSLFLTLAKDYGGRREKRPSGFLKELDLETQQYRQGAEFAKQLSWLKTVPQINVQPKKIIFGKLNLSYLSYSQIETFNSCPLKYKYKYILQVPAKPHHALTFGQTIHNTLRDFHRFEIKGQSLNLKQFLYLYKQYFIHEGYYSESHKLKRFKEGKKFLRKYFKSFRTIFSGTPFLLEKSFRIKIGDIPFIGKIDRIDKIGSNFELIDYKTGKAKQQNEVDRDSQLTIYSLGAESALGIKPGTLSLFFIENGIKISTRRSKEQIVKKRDELQKIMAEIKISKFPPKPNYPIPCGFCDYNLICPYAKK